MQVGDIVKYKVDEQVKTGVIYRVGDYVQIGGDSVTSSNIVKKIKSLEIGDVMLIKTNSWSDISPVVLSDIFVEQYEEQEYYHYTWMYLENGKLVEGDCFPLEYIIVPDKIHNIVHGVLTPKGDSIGIPSNKQIYDFNQNLDKHNFDIGDLVVFGSELWPNNESNLIKGVGVITSRNIKESVVKGYFYNVSDNDFAVGRDNSLIFPLNRQLQYGDIVRVPKSESHNAQSSSVSRGVVLTYTATSVSIYNISTKTIEAHPMKGVVVENISNNEGKLADKLTQIVANEMFNNYL